MIAFTNHNHTFSPFRLSDNETEIIQLLKDGWFPVRDDDTPIPVSKDEDGNWLLDGKTIADALLEPLSTLFLDRLAGLFTDKEWDYMDEVRKRKRF